jgi:1-phosphofructokinase
MILTVTLNPAVDHTVRLNEPLNTGSVQRTSDVHFDAGGKGINVSKYLSGLGTDTIATGIFGGFLGSFMERRLSEDDIPHDFVEIDDQTRLNTTVLANEEYKINHTGPTVDVSVIDAIVERIRSHAPETVVVAGSLPPSLDVSAIDRIMDSGNWETVVDIGGRNLQQLTGAYTLCKPNREELAAATGEPTTTLEDCFRAAETLRSGGFDRVVASLGADGAVLVTRSETLHASAVDTDVIDTVGAGDALLAGVLAAFAQDSLDEKALQTGVAVASRVVAVPGTTVPLFSSIEDIGELDVNKY